MPVMLLFCLLMLARMERRGLSALEWFGLGAAAGCAVLVKASGALVLGGVFVFSLLRSAPGERLLNIARLAIAAAPPVGAALAYNTLRTGDWASSGYGEGIDAWGFSTPFLEGVWQLLTSPGKGVLWFAPGALLGAWVIGAWKKRPLGLLIGAIALAQLGVASAEAHLHMPKIAQQH